MHLQWERLMHSSHWSALFVSTKLFLVLESMHLLKQYSSTQFFTLIQNIYVSKVLTESVKKTFMFFVKRMNFVKNRAFLVLLSY